MKIVNVLIWVLFFACVTSLAGCGGMDTAEQESKQDLSFAQVERHDVLYSCSCGQQCKCNTVSTKPGKCDCGRILKWGHVLKIEGTEAILCQCAKGCRCYFNSKDSSKCTCGKPTKRVSLVGTGICFCNCGGGGGFCNYVSDSPGKCRCGNKLIKAG